MNILFEKPFLKSLDKISDSSIKSKIATIILNVKSANNLSDIKQIKKLKGFKNFYRIKLGDYRIGIELLDNNTIVFILVLHRKDIYKKFP